MLPHEDDQPATRTGGNDPAQSLGMSDGDDVPPVETSASTGRRGRTRRTTAPSLLLLLAVGVGVGWLLLRSNAELPPGHFSRRLASCVPEKQAAAHTEAEAAACLVDVLLEADRAGALGAARRDLGTLVTTDPRIHNYCHLAEHRTGAILMREPGRVPRLIMENPENICSWGIGHGLLETFGAARADEAAWRDVLATCRGLRAMPDPYPEVYALCADGVGHAAWDHHRDVTGAARRCAELLEESAVSACTAGVMMQQYRPAETGKQPPLDPSGLVSYCTDTWPRGNRAGTEGCANGIGYVLSLSLIGDAVSAELDAGKTGVDAARTAGEGLRHALTICATQSEWAETCEASVLANLPRHLLTGEDLGELCAAAGETRTRCSN